MIEPVNWFVQLDRMFLIMFVLGLALFVENSKRKNKAK